MRKTGLPSTRHARRSVRTSRASRPRHATRRPSPWPERRCKLSVKDTAGRLLRRPAALSKHPSRTRMKRVGLLIFPGFQILDIAALSVFEVANTSQPEPAYAVRILSEHGGPVLSSSGVSIDSERVDGEPYDTVIVAGSLDIVPSTAGLLDLVREAADSTRRLASICTGAFILAEAGVLDG